jgi:hypothetical protein
VIAALALVIGTEPLYRKTLYEDSLVFQRGNVGYTGLWAIYTLMGGGVSTALAIILLMTIPG